MEKKVFEKQLERFLKHINESNLNIKNNKTLTCFDNDHQKEKDVKVKQYNKKPTEDDLANDIIKYLTNKIDWFNEEWLTKNKDVKEEIYKLANDLLKNGESRFIYTYKFYLK